MSQFSLGFSPCPNDTFIFDALVHQKVPHGFQFDVSLEDVETLNQSALTQEFDISKISIHAFFHVAEHYQLLSSGAALGRGCGPLVIGKGKTLPKSGKVALPGKLTTASFLFQAIAKNNNYEVIQMPFDQIMPAILDGTVDLGVIIHESRFTYQTLGLNLLFDLGQWWEETTQSPLPLGGIMVRRSLAEEKKIEVQSLIQKSIIYAEKSPSESQSFMSNHAQEMDTNVMKQHVELYVNDFSKDLGSIGKNAIELMYKMGVDSGILKANPNIENRLFI
ncbi:MAG: 1,4-dihydroxy-6-naphthoate synthase [bacterium]|jgi:1,4-dihydroxy-6-naphthoate synthase